MDKPIKIKNWHKFQHFKDRRPPWVKLHREIMEQRDINTISDCSFRVLVNLWLLASEDETLEGIIPPIDDIVFRLRIEKKKIIKALEELKPFLIQDDITEISGQYQLDEPEKSRDRVEEEADSMSGKPDDVKKSKFSQDSTDLLNILNALSGKTFRPVDTNLKLIEARLKSGIPKDTLHAMLGMMCDKWKGTDMDKFLRPTTLFGLEKCEQYIGEIDNKPTYADGAI